MPDLPALGAEAGGLPHGLFVLAPDGRISYVNPAAARLLGGPVEDLVGQPAQAVLHPPRADGAPFPVEDCPIHRALAQGQPTAVDEAIFWRRDGTGVPVEYLITPLLEGGEVTGGVVIFKDITVRQQAQAERDQAWQFLQVVLDNIEDGVVACDGQGVLTLFNRAARTFHGVCEQPLPPQAWTEHYDLYLADGQTPMSTEALPLYRALQGEAVRGVEVVIKPPARRQRVLRVNAQPLLDAQGHRLGAVASLHDITDDRAYLARLEHQATHDALTQLPNRSLLNDRLDHALNQARRWAHGVGVLCLDLDRFKVINDSLGHGAGDTLLQAAAQRLRSAVRVGDTLARPGGDEFVIVLEGLHQEAEAGAVAHKLIQVLEAPFGVAGETCFISASIGISLFPRDGQTAGTLLRHADTALYRAKEQGGCYRHAGGGDDQHLERLRLEKQLRQALAHRELELHYQPQLDLAQNRIVGVEALVRWRHPERGLVPPGHFIPLAEATGLILPIGDWVLRQACAQAVAWRAAGLPALRMAVNLSARQFQQPDLVDRVARTLQDTGLPADRLKLEITESLLMKDIDAAVTTLHQIKALGVRISIDDFGTGYSSLAYLKRFPLNQLKIDRSFVQDITTDPDAAAIALAVIALARSLNLHVVAEGVETKAQQEFLRTRGCEEIQGYHLSRPLPAPELAAFLRVWPQPQRVPPLKDRGRHTVLLVDDEPNVTAALSRRLQPQGYAVLSARSAREALELLACHPVGVVISDCFMPDLNGPEFLRRVNDLYPQTVRILMTGQSDLEIVVQAVNTGGIYRFLLKPVAEELLQRSVREALAIYGLRRRAKARRLPGAGEPARQGPSNR